jgi:hypothetical protein
MAVHADDEPCEGARMNRMHGLAFASTLALIGCGGGTERAEPAPAATGGEVTRLTSDQITMRWPGEPQREEREIAGVGILRTYSIVTDTLRLVSVISPRLGSPEEELEGALMSIALSDLGPRVTASESRPAFSRLGVPSQGVTAHLPEGTIYQDAYVLEDATLILMVMVMDGSEIIPPDAQAFLSSVAAH